MFARALLAFLALPGLLAFLLPPVIAYFDPWAGATWLPGLALTVVGTGVLLWCVRDFYKAGKGTLAPWDPPKNLVVIGLYKFVRNPMFVAVTLLLTGWTLYFSSPALIGYTILMAAGFGSRVVRYEEPTLEGLFGADWLAYKAQVPRWIPRLPRAAQSN